MNQNTLTVENVIFEECIFPSSLSNLMGNNLRQIVETIKFIDCATTRVETMSCMFDACYSVTEIDLGIMDTSNVTDMTFMFASCRALKSLDLSNWDLSNIEYENQEGAYLFNRTFAKIKAPKEMGGYKRVRLMTSIYEDEDGVRYTRLTDDTEGKVLTPVDVVMN